MYSSKGGIRYGKNYLLSLNYSYPFARLQLSEDTLEIKYPFFNKIIIDKGSINRILLMHGFLFSPGIRIIHTSTDIDPYLIFWTFNRNEVINKLKKLKYPIE
jgi:hypothetical protein